MRGLVQFVPVDLHRCMAFAARTHWIRYIENDTKITTRRFKMFGLGFFLLGGLDRPFSNKYMRSRATEKTFIFFIRGVFFIRSGD